MASAHPTRRASACAPAPWTTPSASRQRSRSRALFKQGEQPDRTLVFAAWTAEERGLLGSEYYATNPLLPLETTVANLTMDVLQPNGLARDVVLVGAGQSELEGLLARKAAGQNRVVTPDAKPERGLALPRRPLSFRQARRARSAAHGHRRRPRPGERRA